MSEQATPNAQSQETPTDAAVATPAEEDVTLPSDVAAAELAANEDTAPKPSGEEEKPAEATEEPSEEETTETTVETSLSEEDQTATKELYGDAVGDIMIKANLVGEDVAKEYAEKGTLTDEQFTQFNEAGFPKDMVEAYMAGIKAQADGAVEAQAVFTNEMQEAVGGKQAFDTKIAWFAKTASEADIKDYNDAVNGDSPAAAKLAVKNMDLQYEKANGKSPNLMNTENASSSGGQDYYRSMEDVTTDMGDPRYKSSKAYQSKVSQKIERSTKAGFLRK